MKEQHNRKAAADGPAGPVRPDGAAAGAGESCGKKAAERPVASAARPLKVLSTSLGAVLVANLLLTHAQGEASPDGAEQPKLVEWSTEEVKQYFDPNTDWSIPLSALEGAQGAASAAPQPSASPSAGAAAEASSGGGSGGGTVIVQQGGGFGWDDLLLYHLIFNNGGAYSSSGWVGQRPVYDSRTNQPYQPRSYASGAFQNKPVAGSNVRTPKTSSKKGAFNTKPGSGSSTASGSVGNSSGVSSQVPGSKSGSGTSTTTSTSSSGGTSFSSSGKSTSSSPGSIGGSSSGFSSGSSSSGS